MLTYYFSFLSLCPWCSFIPDQAILPPHSLSESKKIENAHAKLFLWCAFVYLQTLIKHKKTHCLTTIYPSLSSHTQPWSWPRIKQTFRRQSRSTRISLTISGGLVILYILVWTGGFLRHHHTHLRHFDNDIYNDEDHHSSGASGSSSSSMSENHTPTLREQGQACNPRIQQAIPLPPRILSNGTHDFDPTVIVLSFDGLRADYLKRGITPNFMSVGKRHGNHNPHLCS